MCELDLYFLKIYQMCENEFPTSSLLKVIILQPRDVHASGRLNRSGQGGSGQGFCKLQRVKATSLEIFFADKFMHCDMNLSV